MLFSCSVSYRASPSEPLFRQFLETVRKVLSTGQTPRHQPLHGHVDEGLAGFGQLLVVPKLFLRFCPSQEKVLSTTHLFGKKGLGPSGGKSFFGSNSTPSLAHSLAH